MGVEQPGGARQKIAERGGSQDGEEKEPMSKKLGRLRLDWGNQGERRGEEEGHSVCEIEGNVFR